MKRNPLQLLSASVLAAVLLLAPAAPRAQQFALRDASFAGGYTDAGSAEYAIVGMFGEPLVVTAVSNDFGINILLIQEEPTGVESDPIPTAANFLASNFPNPFNPATIIRYGIKQRGRVSLRIYDVAGRLVRTLVDEVQDPGVDYQVAWHGLNDRGRRVASGVYFCRLTSAGFSETRKMVLLR